MVGIPAAWAVAGGAEFAPVFGDGMVLPHDRPIPVWGRGEVGEAVKVSFGAQQVAARCGVDGSWKVVLKAEAAAAVGRKLVLVGSHKTTELKDVLVGEVWMCSGQSNMDFPLGKAIGGKEEAAKAGNFSSIRLCSMTGVRTDHVVYQKSDCDRLKTEEFFHGRWEVATPASASAISAVGWWVARLVYESRGMPVGVIENAVGGSGAEAWLPIEVLRRRVEYQPLMGSLWLEHPKISGWARGRARRNLGSDITGNHPFKPGFLFESGVRPWVDFPFDGVLWYQGETNAEVADDGWNERMITDLIDGWRSVLGVKDLPFYMVQLPRIGGRDPLRAHWPEFRQVQARAAASRSGVHLVVTQDLGWDSPDVHQPDKLPIAKRIAASILEQKN